MELWQWNPGPRVRDQLPSEFNIQFLCCTAADGQRRLIPAGPTESYVLEAAMSGLALLSARRGMSFEQRRSYRTMQFLHGRVHKLREHLGRDFAYSRDLFVSQSARTSHDEPDVLPPDLGSSIDQPERRWSD